jgi:nucleoside 2-deoxyribosyltransferase
MAGRVYSCIQWEFTTMKNPSVFVIMPFAAPWRDVYELGIKAGCVAAGAEVARIDEQIFHQNILIRLYSQIAQADFIVAEMTEPNPNVYYEVGYAHGVGRPVLLITKTLNSVPFDLKHYPFIQYESIVTLKTELEKRLKMFIANPELTADMFNVSLTTRMAMHIQNYLRHNNFDMMSFDRIRQRINASYTNEMLLKLIDERPDKFKRALLKGGKDGIGVVTAA